MSTISSAGAVAKHSSFHLNMGDVPTWVGAGAAILAVIGAFAIYKIESARDRFTAGERRDRAEAQRRTQADRVAAWYGASEEGPGPMVRRFYGAYIRNASDLPIYEVRVSFRFVTPQPDDLEHSTERSMSEPIRVLPPDETQFVVLDQSVLRQTDPDSHPDYVVAIEFRDAAGTRWRRDAKGGLTERAA